MSLLLKKLKPAKKAAPSEKIVPLFQLSFLAETVGFEPTCRLPGKRISSAPRYGRFGTSPFPFRIVNHIALAVKFSSIITFKAIKEGLGQHGVSFHAGSYLFVFF